RRPLLPDQLQDDLGSRAQGRRRLGPGLQPRGVRSRDEARSRSGREEERLISMSGERVRSVGISAALSALVAISLLAWVAPALAVDACKNRGDLDERYCDDNGDL